MPTPQTECLSGSIQSATTVFSAWVNQVEATGAQVIPIDGKSVKGSMTAVKQSALHLVSAWAVRIDSCLGK